MHTHLDDTLDFTPRFDADGLITAIACDAQSGVVVMVAYMNAESLATTRRTRIATYWSRSRQKLWVKGEESGHTQHVERMQVDCDQDVVLLTVTTAGTGANCHTGRKSCFYRDVALASDASKDALTICDDERLFDPKVVYKS